MTMTDETPPTGPDARAGDLGDLPESNAQPVIMLDAYVEIGAANLSCLGMEVSVEPENKPIELTTFCGVKDYPGPVKWHFKAKLAQSFDTGHRRDAQGRARRVRRDRRHGAFQGA